MFKIRSLAMFLSLILTPVFANCPDLGGEYFCDYSKASSSELYQDKKIVVKVTFTTPNIYKYSDINMSGQLLGSAEVVASGEPTAVEGKQNKATFSCYENQLITKWTDENGNLVGYSFQGINDAEA